MKRSILSRFVLFSVAVLAITLGISFIVNRYNSKDIANSYYERAATIADEAQEVVSQTSYDELFSDSTGNTYQRIRKELRYLCQISSAKYTYLFEVDDARTTRTYLFCTAEDDDSDKKLLKVRPFGATSSEPFTKQELQAAEAKTDVAPYVSDNEFGNDLCWYFPIKIEGSKQPIVFGVDFDVEEERQEIWDYTLTFAIPLLVGVTCVMVFELAILKKTVTDPLRTLASRMRSFTQDGVQNHEHVAVGKTTEIADIESSFNQMTDDIETFVERIAIMSEERATVVTELEVARRIQHGLVPPSTHCKREGFDAYAFERTARAVGGDFYDLTELDCGKLLLIIADVSGKGVSAALFMAMFRTLLHDKLQTYMDPARAVNEVNDIVAVNNPENMFVTLIAGVFDPKTRVLTFANAGHTPPLVISGSYLSPDPGIALGLFEDVGITNETLKLMPGEGVLLYTDGATEAVNPQDEFFGEERLMDAVWEKRDAQSAVQAVVDKVDAFAGDQEQFDDLTMLALFAPVSNHMDWHKTLPPELSSFSQLSEHVLRLCGTNPKAKQVVLACDEAFANVVNYSGATAIDASLHLNNNVLVARLADDGTPFDPLAHEAEERDFEELDMGGMGIMLIREVCDEVTYEHVNGKNVFTMKFNL